MASKKTLMIVAVIAIVAIAIIAAAAAMSGSNNASTNGSDNNNNTREQIANVTFSGTSSNVTSMFTLEVGLTIFHMNYTGTDNFIIWMYNETGTKTELLANEVGSYDGSQLIGVRADNIMGATPGQYYLGVETTGAWNVTVEQPRVSSGSGLPQTLSGSGEKVSMPIQLTSGVAIFNLTHDGDGDLLVTLWADNGVYVALLANELGAYSGEKSVTVDGKLFNASPGIHWINIDADGAWTIRITKM
jgi:opacity protein-like surface antigen